MVGLLSAPPNAAAQINPAQLCICWAGVGGFLLATVPQLNSGPLTDWLTGLVRQCRTSGLLKVGAVALPPAGPGEVGAKSSPTMPMGAATAACYMEARSSRQCMLTCGQVMGYYRCVASSCRP